VSSVRATFPDLSGGGLDEATRCGGVGSTLPCGGESRPARRGLRLDENHDLVGGDGDDPPADHRKRGNGREGQPGEAVPRGAARRAAESRGNGSRPERPPSAPRRPHRTDQPAAGACPRPGSPSAADDRRESAS